MSDDKRDPRLTQILQDLAHGQGMTEIEAQRAILDTMRSGRNRWAAFTNDELTTLALRLIAHHPAEHEWNLHDLYAEIEAELERRHP